MFIKIAWQSLFGEVAYAKAHAEANKAYGTKSNQHDGD